jgi:hypothetical protein
MGKTARFSELVARCGAPSQYLPWVDPKRDPLFQKALQERRVLTVVQSTTGNAKDYGVVGLASAKSLAYFVFPRSLSRYAENRIVAINYDLLTAATRESSRPKAKQRKPQKAKPARPKKVFEVAITCTSIVQITERVEAESTKAAMDIAGQGVQTKTIDFADGEISHRIAGVKSVR